MNNYSFETIKCFVGIDCDCKCLSCHRL